MSEKHLVCQGATVYCNKSVANNNPGTAVPLTITSQTLVVLNGGKTAATDKDCTPANMCFGNCKCGTNPPPPCVPNVQWSKCFEDADVTAAGMKFLTEKSEATCMTFGGKVKIAYHGQSASPQPEELNEVSKEIIAAILPVDPDEKNDITFEEEEPERKVIDAYWIDEATGEKRREVIEGQEVDLYIETEGYRTGETVTVNIAPSKGNAFENSGKEISASATVDADGMAVVKLFEMNYK